MELTLWQSMREYCDTMFHCGGSELYKARSSGVSLGIREWLGVIGIGYGLIFNKGKRVFGGIIGIWSKITIALPKIYKRLEAEKDRLV